MTGFNSKRAMVRDREYFALHEDPDYDDNGQLDQGPAVTEVDVDAIWKQIVDELNKFSQTD
jgi:hypothetical protein